MVAAKGLAKVSASSPRPSRPLRTSLRTARTLSSIKAYKTPLHIVQSREWNPSTSFNRAGAKLYSTEAKTAPDGAKAKRQIPSFASFAMKPKVVPRSERTPIPNRDTPARDPWRVTTGTWYSPELKKREVARQIIERDYNMPELVHSTPESLPYPSTEAQERLLTEIHLKIDSTPPSILTSELLPYFGAIGYYKNIFQPKALQNPLPIPDLTLSLGAAIGSLQSLPSPSSEASMDSNDHIPLLLIHILTHMKEFMDEDSFKKAISTVRRRKTDSEGTINSNVGDSKDVNYNRYEEDTFAEEETAETALELTLTPDQARMMSETSKDHLSQLMPALVEADVYYAAEVMTGVLKERGVLELSETLKTTLNPRQLTALLPAMCRVNPEWREDGFFDLMVEVLSLGGILRWEPEDIAAVLAALPKVPISQDYYIPPEIDPTSPENALKSSDELLKLAQKMAIDSRDERGPRWDVGAYGMPGEFFLRPSKEDVEAAKREFEEEMKEGEQEIENIEKYGSEERIGETTIGENPEKEVLNHGFSEIKSETIDLGEKNDLFGGPKKFSSKSEESDREPIDILDYLDVSKTVLNNSSGENSSSSGIGSTDVEKSSPAFYNPIAWQPEELGRLIGTMLSQELELDDIVHVMCGLAIEGWKEEGNNDWHSFMGYFSTVVSDALTVNKHWIDEDYTWVLHDVIGTIGPWALRQWPEYGVEEHQKWLAELISQVAIKYGRFKHDYRFIQIALNMICDNWPDIEHQKLADLIQLRMKDRTLVGRAQNWYKWRISKEYDAKFSDQRASQSQLWMAPYNSGKNPKLPTLISSAGLRELGIIESIQKAIYETEDSKLSPPSRTGAKPQNELQW